MAGFSTVQLADRDVELWADRGLRLRVRQGAEWGKPYAASCKELSARGRYEAGASAGVDGAVGKRVAFSPLSTGD